MSFDINQKQQHVATEPDRDIIVNGKTVGTVLHRPQQEGGKYQACMHSAHGRVSAFGWGDTPEQAVHDLATAGIKQTVDSCEAMVNVVYEMNAIAT